MQLPTLHDPASEVVPEGHDKQEVLCLFRCRYMLAGQMQFNTLVDPAGEVVPEGHDKQEDPPLYVLVGQMQCD